MYSWKKTWNFILNPGKILGFFHHICVGTVSVEVKPKKYFLPQFPDHTEQPGYYPHAARPSHLPSVLVSCILV